MTLEEAIQYEKELIDNCDQKSEYHQQLIDWLTELKNRKDDESWTIYDAIDGDIVFYETDYDEKISYIIIFESLYRRNAYELAEGINHYLLYCPEEGWFEQDNICIVNYWNMDKFKQATDEQKQMLFDALKKYGYEWDPENKNFNKI